MGIYTIVFDKEITCKKNYKRCSALISTCLGLQIIFGAALTAIGASNSSSRAVTVLGTFNTITASILTFLKGSGLPNRLRYFQHEWGALREHIEQKERDLILGYRLNVREEVETIRQMYEQIKKDIESNTPERFASATGGIQSTKPEGSGVKDKINRLSQLLETHVATLAQSGGAAMRNAEDDAVQTADSKRESATNWATAEKNRIVAKSKETVQVGRAQAENEFQSSVQTPATEWLNDRQTDINTAINKGDHTVVQFSDGLAAVKDKLAAKLGEIQDLQRDLEKHASLATAQSRQGADQLRGAAEQRGQDTVNQTTEAALEQTRRVANGVASQANDIRSAAAHAAQQATEALAGGATLINSVENGQADGGLDA